VTVPAEKEEAIEEAMAAMVAIVTRYLYLPFLKGLLVRCRFPSMGQ
jgi:hypothetical protein